MRPLIIKDKFIGKGKIESFSDFKLEDNYLIKESDDGFKIDGKILLRGNISYGLEKEEIEKIIDVNVFLPYEKLESRSMIKLLIDKAEFDKNDNLLLIKIKIKVVGEEEIKEKLVFREERKMEFPPKEMEVSEKLGLNDEFLKQMEDMFSNNKDVEVVSTLDDIDNEVKEDIFEVRMEDKVEPLPLIDDDLSTKNQEKEQLLKTEYVTTFFFYRVKDNDSLDEILKKYNMTRDEFTKLNNKFEIHPNDLIQIKLK